ncbi:unnamed protein product [Vitrella brassicaformis CCMP3155]|uniref:Uncharacterized protein n=1 Tax=Vitrella brassicaformis (strain CCMP3155) TaxID=1169540 RepID=A0A0G4H7N1_VITBC|nr:unnamed protein product [Vitrella brassicaformis CCMP3155]|mmetsp:Transcript_43151/g.107819  ORF Transcript_43151/g.107819 Transcript_43151/m.107819 type:complete len:176 (+) Transcript_43151:2-529(+)|eukprot:CEM39924.1 unnamed protein product [Vitrella brassicaformis CCMP3155]
MRPATRLLTITAAVAIFVVAASHDTDPSDVVIEEETIIAEGITDGGQTLYGVVEQDIVELPASPTAVNDPSAGNSQSDELEMLVMYETEPKKGDSSVGLHCDKRLRRLQGIIDPKDTPGGKRKHPKTSMLEDIIGANWYKNDLNYFAYASTATRRGAIMTRVPVLTALLLLFALW